MIKQDTIKIEKLVTDESITELKVERETGDDVDSELMKQDNKQILETQAESTSCLNTYTGIENESTQTHHVNVKVEIEIEPYDEVDSEIDKLYTDHVIKEEMVIGPEVPQHVDYNLDCCKDAEILNETMGQSTTQEPAKGMDTEEIITSNADLNKSKRKNIQTKQKVNSINLTENCKLLINHQETILEAGKINTNLKKSSNKYVCDSCGQRFKNKCELAKHIKQTNTQKLHMKNYFKNVHFDNKSDVFVCVSCGERFAKKCELAKHIERTYKQKLHLKNRLKNVSSVKKIDKNNINPIKPSNAFICDSCGLNFEEKCELAKHIEQRHTQKFNLKNNLKNVHPGKKVLMCHICPYITNDISSLNRHLIIHSGNKPVCTDDSKNKCIKKSELTEQEIHTGQKSYNCSECNYKCSYKSHLKRHLMIHTGEKPFSCSVCSYKCSKKSYLKSHLMIHSGEKPYSCSECDYKCIKKSTLTTHLTTHTDEKPYSCSACNYKCRQKSSLKTHLKTHTGEKPYSCSECNYKCSQKSNLKIHLTTHTGEKPYSCSVCNYKSSQKNSLKTHLTTHSSEKLFSCSVCNYKCSRKRYLTEHLKIHNVKPFSCTECSYKCSYKSQLKTHSMIHSGEKPFSCSLCNYRCIKKSYLKPHLKTHTGEKP